MGIIATSPKSPVLRNKHRILAYVAITLLGALAYSNSFVVPYYLDDEITIQDNPSIRNLTELARVLDPPNHVFSAGRPLLNLSFAINYWFHGESVPGYHILNLTIHACSAIVLFELLFCIMGIVGADWWSGPARALISFTAAVAWLLHPVQTASITYISQRAESMMGLCYLLTVLCFLKASGENRSRAWQLGTIASFLCGVGVKENIVTAPVFCLLIDQVLLSGSLRSAWRRNRYTYVMFLLGFGVFAIVALAGGLQDRMALNSGTHDYVRHLWIQVRAVGHYLQLACWPSPLIFDHGIDLDVLDRISLPFGLMVTGGLVLGASLTYLRYPALSLLPVWFLITLAPTTSLIPVYGAPVAENRVYLASIAVSITSVIVASIFLHRRAVAPLACALIALGVITHRRNDDYRDRVCLWNDTVAKTPGNHRALGWSGIALLATPDGVREGINRLEAARRMRPGSADTNCNLGRAYLQIGDFRRAILYFREALALRPNDAFAHIGLSVALRQSGEPVSQAIAHAKAAVQCRPDRVDFSSVLGALLLDAGLVDESTKELERAVRLNEQFTQAHMNLGNAYMATPGRLDEAVASYRRALELSPSSFAILFNLGNALLQQGANLREAESCYERTLEINPEYKPARDKLESIRSRMNSGTGGTQRPRLGTN